MFFVRFIFDAFDAFFLSMKIIIIQLKVRQSGNANDSSKKQCNEFVFFLAQQYYDRIAPFVFWKNFKFMKIFLLKLTDP